jgi:hypothetical protein
MSQPVHANKRMKTPLPEYRPQCLRGLYRLLGLSDATVEWIEVAVRHLSHINTDEGVERVSDLAVSYGVRVNNIDFVDLPSRWASLQVLSVYQKLEWFLVEFREEHPRDVRGRKSDEDLLSYTLDSFDVSKHAVGVLEFEILDYYRLARNRLMHAPSAPQLKTHVTQHSRIERLKENTTYGRLSAPNTIDALNFDDFILFSRALKNLARNLCAATCPTADELVARLKKDPTLCRILNRTKQNQERMQKSLASYLQRCYGFPSCANELSAAMLRLCPLAQW